MAKKPFKIISDIHLEFGWLDVPPEEGDKDTILILAGDIGIASKKHTYVEFVEDMSTQFKAVIMIMGNHEFYSGKFLTAKTKMIEALSDCPNVHILEKESIVFDDVAIICATLWTNMDNCNSITMYDAQLKMNDYKQIRHGPPSEPWKRTLLPKDTVEDHVNAVAYIFPEIEKQKADGKKVVVVTHHAPSWQSVAEQYKNEPLNGAYVSNLDERIIEANPEVWCHGHTHVSFDYMIGDTRVICNPRGYANQSPSDLNPEFKSNFTFEL